MAEAKDAAGPRRIPWLRRQSAWVGGSGLFLALGCVAAYIGLSGPDGQRGRAEAQGAPRGNGAEDTEETRQTLLAGLDLNARRLEGEQLVTELEGGREAVLSIDPGLQAHVEGQYARYEVPFGSLVALEPATGRVLAYVSHSTANPEAGDLALDPTPPSASVFKTVSAAALVDAGVDGSTEVCYHGGSSRLREQHLRDSEDDSECATLADALGSSINSIFAKLAVRHLDTPTVERYAQAFGYGQAVPFDIPTQTSPFDVPDHEADRLEFARTSAGFWHMHMSPLHGAVIAAVFASGGNMVRPTLVDTVRSPSGEQLLDTEPRVLRRVIPRATARAVGRMMERTVTHGTARRSFFDRRGQAFLPGIRVAGKTGTLSGSDPYRGYSWWVGFAPADEPTIALAALVVNEPRWRIKASYIAREALRHYLVVRARRAANDAE